MDRFTKSIIRLKSGRWQARWRSAACARWGSETCEDTPSVLGNAMPKSGSHLINQVVQGLIRLGPFVNPGFPPVNRDEVNDKLPDEEVLANLNPDAVWGYRLWLYQSPPAVHFTAHAAGESDWSLSTAIPGI